MDIVVPEVGESVFEATISKWHVKDGSQVAKEDLLCELETDKISLELHAERDGVITLKAQEGETVKVGATIATLGEGADEGTSPKDDETEKGKSGEAEEDNRAKEPRREQAKKGQAKEEKPPQKTPAEPAPKAGDTEKTAPAADKKSPPELPSKTAKLEAEGRITRVAMTPIRKKIAAHLLAARQQTAMLTTFNEADLSQLLKLRKERQEAFQAKHEVKLGLMSFFVRACVLALQEFEAVNARIDGDDILYQHFYDIGVAIGGEKGLVVPVIRNADQLNYAEVESTIRDFAEKVEKNKIELADLEGGTFTISNGGVYGSLLSTPILSPPQCAVLGMHAIQDRVMAIDGQMEIRPMMYLALSYDHRLIDGRQAVGFLKKIKEFVEKPDEAPLDL